MMDSSLDVADKKIAVMVKNPYAKKGRGASLPLNTVGAMAIKPSPPPPPAPLVQTNHNAANNNNKIKDGAASTTTTNNDNLKAQLKKDIATLKRQKLAVLHSLQEEQRRKKLEKQRRKAEKQQAAATTIAAAAPTVTAPTLPTTTTPVGDNNGSTRANHVTMPSSVTTRPIMTDVAPSWCHAVTTTTHTPTNWHTPAQPGWCHSAARTTTTTTASTTTTPLPVWHYHHHQAAAAAAAATYHHVTPLATWQQQHQQLQISPSFQHPGTGNYWQQQPHEYMAWWCQRQHEQRMMQQMTMAAAALVNFPSAAAADAAAADAITRTMTPPASAPLPSTMAHAADDPSVVRLARPPYGPEIGQLFALHQPIAHVLTKRRGEAFGLTLHTRTIMPSATIMVLGNVHVQNDRRQKMEPPHDALLHPHDMLLTVHDQDVGGRTFPEACRMFAQCPANDNDDWIRCRITVARRRQDYGMDTSPRLLVDYDASATTPPAVVPRTGPLSSDELVALGKIVLHVILDPTRPWGGELPADLLQAQLPSEPLLTGRSIPTLQQAWKAQIDSVLRQVGELGRQHYAREWQQESAVVRGAHHDAMIWTEAMRHQARARARPAVGCKCKSKQHSRVSDPTCVLYSNLRRLMAASSSASTFGHDDDAVMAAELPKAKKIKLDRELNAVEAAYRDRFVKMRAEQAADQAEAAFVAHMEKFQLEQLGRAVFAPSLNTMVLCAIFELQSEPGKSASPSVEEHVKSNDDDADEDDDDVPLVALEKEVKKSAVPSIEYLGRLVQRMSRKWGHVYAEADDIEHAWYWEANCGSSVRANDGINSGNPRRRGSLSLENIHLLQPFSTLAATVLIDPTVTGVADHVMSMVDNKMAMVQDDGDVTMADDWAVNASFTLLEEKADGWGKSMAHARRHGVPRAFWNALDSVWSRTELGWALRDDEGDIVYTFTEFRQWRNTFEQQYRDAVDGLHGIGRFGV